MEIQLYNVYEDGKLILKDAKPEQNVGRYLYQKDIQRICLTDGCVPFCAMKKGV